MKCPNCGFENREEAKFCGKCGKSLRLEIEPEKALKEIEEKENAAKEAKQLERREDVWESSKQVIDMKTKLYVKTGKKVTEESGFLGYGKKKVFVDDFVEKEIQNQIEIRQNSMGMEFVMIPAGEFDMGSPLNEVSSPVRHVKLAKAFYMSKYEVTQKQWREVMETNPSYFTVDDLPIVNVSWDEVQKFIKKLNEKENTTKYRLPTEAEWEYAARAGTTTSYYFGDDKSKLGDHAWYNENSSGKTHPVGQKKPNSWGLYDAEGNVWEWVQDKWHDNYSGAPTDGSAWESGKGSLRVLRGGSCGSIAEYCRSASRSHDAPGSRSNYLGFRLLKEL